MLHFWSVIPVKIHRNPHRPAHGFGPMFIFNASNTHLLRRLRKFRHENLQPSAHPPSQALNLSCLTQPLLDPTTWGCTASGSCTTCPNSRPGARPQAAEALGSFSGRGCPFLPVGTDGEVRMQRQGHRSPEEVKVSLNPPISDRTGHRGGQCLFQTRTSALVWRVPK